jgi:hypothetical protein
MSQPNTNRFDCLSLFYGVGGTLSVAARDTLDKLNKGEPLPEGQKAGRISGMMAVEELKSFLKQTRMVTLFRTKSTM